MQDMNPASLEELVLKPDTRRMLEGIISGKFSIAETGKSGLLLYGPPGTGKTTAANIIPSLLDPMLGKRPNRCDMGGWFGLITYSGIRKLDWSCGAGGGGKNRGITLINEIENALMNGQRGESGFAYIILNEVDEMVPEAMGSLRSLMDRHLNVVWSFTTNRLEKVEQAVVDRSYSLDFGAADVSEWAKRCNQILARHSIPALSEEELEPLYDSSGSARSIINFLKAALSDRLSV